MINPFRQLPKAIKTIKNHTEFAYFYYFNRISTFKGFSKYRKDEYF